MPRKRRTKPAYQLHKATGQARVRIDGRDCYLGAHGSPESKTLYQRLVREWMARQDGLATTVGDVAAAWLEHADGYYRKNGARTSEYACFKAACDFLKPFAGELALDFGPRKLKKVQDAMVAARLARTTINRQTSRIKQVFRWAVSEELIPADTLAALESVSGLRKGRTAAVETEPVGPVSIEHVEAIQSHVSRPVWGLIQFQLLTGCRPGEALNLRWCDIDRRGEVWQYHPREHKTEHHERDRVICIGPDAQALLAQYQEEESEFVFSPQSVREVVPDGTRQPGRRYDRSAYRNAVVRACRRAGIPEWTPNQLRHTAATQLRSRFGLEVARTVLGHSTVRMTEVYAEQDLEQARKAIRQIG
jgi:integrase